jgi:hypothetical protein
MKKIIFEVLTAVKMSILVVWVVTPCELVDANVSVKLAASFFGAEVLILVFWLERLVDL